MLDRLDRPDRIAGGGAVLGLVASILPWYHFDDGATRVTVNAFGTGFLGDVLFLCCATTILLVLARAGVVDTGFRSDSRMVMAAGGIAVAAVVLQVLIGVNGSGAFHGATIGVAAALLAASACLVGAYVGRERAGSPLVSRRRG